MANELSRSEVYFYFISWTLGIFYSVYHVYIIGNKFAFLFDDGLVPGWKFLDRKKDACDDEWKIWVEFVIKKLSVWVLIHHLGSRILKKFFIKVLPVWYLLITSAFLVFYYDLRIFFIFLLQPVIFSVFISITKSQILLWMFCYGALFVSFQVLKTLYYSPYSGEIQLMSATLMWIYLRCISFCNFVRFKKLDWVLICSFFSYVFYLPCFFLGPIILYDEFYEILNFKSKRHTYKSFVWLIRENLRYFGWLYFTEFSFHFIYIDCQQRYTQLLIDTKNENVWIMYGIGFAMGLFFFLKYTVIYGLAITWTKAEGYGTPDPPKCIARIHLYSEMWRSFDQGLYIFIKRNIFEPCMKLVNPRSLFAKIWVRFLCFVFIYIWHGEDYFVLMWSFLNYCGIVIETVAREVSKTEAYLWIKDWLGKKNERRFLALICAPLTIFSAISNFYFIGGKEVAESYLNFFHKHGTFSSLCCLWFFVYALCHVSMELNAREKIKKQNRIQKL